MEESKLAELALADDAIWEDPVPLTSETVYGYDYPKSYLSQTIQMLSMNSLNSLRYRKLSQGAWGWQQQLCLVSTPQMLF